MPLLLHAYVGLTGFDSDTVAAPLSCVHTAGVDDVVSVSPVDAAIDTEAVAEHPALVTVTVYDPEATLLIEAPLVLLLQWYVGLLGLVTDAEAPPLACPHVVAVDEVLTDNGDEEVTDTLVTAEQPLLFTVTV